MTDRKTHHDIAYALQHSALYTITIIIDTLDTKYWNNKTYVKKTQRKISTKYAELLHRYFVEDFGTQQANVIYGEWLDQYRGIWNADGETKYRSIDEYIHSFDSLTIPSFDIGSNYHISLEKQDTALRGTHLLHWDISHLLRYRDEFNFVHRRIDPPAF